MNPTVLLLTHSRDQYNVDLVAEALRARGETPLRLDTDRLPAFEHFSLRLGSGGFHPSLSGPGDLAEVKAVWLRHLGQPTVPDVDPDYQAICRREWSSVLDALLQSLSGARWMNAPEAAQTAEGKFKQLRLARQAGLRVPETLVTTDAAQVRAFHASQPTGVVMKIQNPLSTSMDGRGPFLYTTALGEEALQELENLEVCPVTFQERVPKACELRVAYVAGRCFAGSVHPSPDAVGVDDWRPAQGLHWQADALPESVVQSLHTLMRALGLNFGAADFIRTPEGDHVFLEVNPSGEWGMLQRDLGLPIAEAIAEALIEPPVQERHP